MPAYRQAVLSPQSSIKIKAKVIMKSSMSYEGPNNNPIQQKITTSSRDLPWYSKNRLEEMYAKKDMTIPEIAERIGKSVFVVHKRLVDADISRQNGDGIRTTHPTYRTNKSGFEEVSGTHYTVLIHRLVMVAEYGVNAVKNRDVHHKNKIPFDNRPNNLELMSHLSHAEYHKHVEAMPDNQSRISDFS